MAEDFAPARAYSSLHVCDHSGRRLLDCCSACAAGWYATAMRARIILAVLGSVSCGCSDDLPPLTQATELHCPAPGNLPFRLASTGFARDSNAALAKAKPRVKDEASDTLGNPGGAVASLYLAEDAAPSAMPISYRGVKARTPVSQGLFSEPLPGEQVSLWVYSDATWNSIGRSNTDSDGIYELASTEFTAGNGVPVYAMLEADGSCAEHFTFLLPRGSKVVVTDIDATLTTSDSEVFLQAGDESHVPAMMAAADRLLQTWAMKGYTIVYLTARPSVLRNETRNWLRDLNFPIGPVITAPVIEEAAPYKTLWLRRIVNDFGWNIVAAYGNADTDITAYRDAAIPKTQTFIVGPLAGTEGTMPIANSDFSDHINSYVNTQPNNSPP